MTQPVLTIRKLSIEYKVSGKKISAVREASFDLCKGQTTALIGESGSGKTTLGRALLGLLDGAGIISGGSIRFAGKSENYAKADEKLWRKIRGREISLILQDPQLTLNPLMKIFDQMLETMRLFSQVSRRKAWHRALALLETMKLEQPQKVLQSYPFQLSGGMCQRVVIAISLINKPKILIADEPTTALDAEIQSGILEELNSLRKQQNLSLLLITHDIDVAAKAADRVIVMKSGKILEKGSTQKVIHHPDHPYTKSLLDCRPCNCWGCGFDELSISTSRLIPSKAYHESPDDCLLDVDGLSYDYQVKGFVDTRSVSVLNEVSFYIRSGEVVGIIGSSGSGKSTLARCLLGLLRVSKGRILFKQSRISGLKGRAFRSECRLIQPIFQQARGALNPGRSIRNIIREPLDYHGINCKKDRNRRVAHLARQVGLDSEILDRRPSQISTGQCQRVAIARALVIEPELLICDEPTSALDLSIQAQILNLLLSLKSKLGFGMLFISHDLEVVKAICDRILVTRNGRLYEVPSNG